MIEYTRLDTDVTNCYGGVGERMALSRNCTVATAIVLNPSHGRVTRRGIIVPGNVSRRDVVCCILVMNVQSSQVTK